MTPEVVFRREALALELRRVYACVGCGARRPGTRLRWPGFRFRATVYRFDAARGMDILHALGPFPPRSPVCPTHTLNRCP